jgi:DNA processing protein
VSDAERFAALQLLRTPGVGPVSWRQLVQRFGNTRQAADALPDLAARGGRRLTLADPRGIAAEFDRVASLGARHIFLTDADYPALLAATDGAPAAIIVRGDVAVTQRPALAMVGARNASAIACRFARQIAAELAREGVTIVSGLARGIDTAAHVGAMAGGATVGVIASGIDICFPPENERLQGDIGTSQLLIAEQPPGTQPIARHFPARNRIIAGLALGTLVVEAAPKSGSLITARRAAEFGREVMAVPGSPLDPRAQGCNLLIREGATLIQSAADVLEMLRPIDARMLRDPGRGWRHDAPAAWVDNADDGDRVRIAELLGPVPVPVDELVRQSGCAPAVVSLVLLELELGGRLERHAGGRVSAA